MLMLCVPFRNGERKREKQSEKFIISFEVLKIESEDGRFIMKQIARKRKRESKKFPSRIRNDFFGVNQAESGQVED